jgi:hypothetical protein
MNGENTTLRLLSENKRKEYKTELSKLRSREEMFKTRRKVEIISVTLDEFGKRNINFASTARCNLKTHS